MSIRYQAVGWNRQKKIYDGLLLIGVVLYLLCFVVLNTLMHPNATFETSLIRAFGSGAFILLHLILCVGPLCRLNRKFLPILYNRRHMGVVMFLMGLVHGGFSLVQFHGFGDLHPITSLLTGNGSFESLSQFPFQPLGFFALLILFLMAATSHDFWLANLTAPVWKALHMLVYLAYALLVAHVGLGILQAETNPLFAVLVGLGLVIVFCLHLAAGLKERGLDQEVSAKDGWVDACAVQDIPEKRAVIVTIAGERVAIFRYDGQLSAVSNVCRHQNGPLGEGKIIDGCITCPWHGYQYKPQTGASPPPFTEKVPVFALKIVHDRVWVDPKPFPPGTAIPSALIACEEG